MRFLRGRGGLVGGVQGFLVILLAWQAFSLLFSAALVPPPLAVLRLFLELLPSVLWRHALASLARVGAALAVSLAAALPLGVAMGRVPLLDRILSPAAYLLYPVPKIALLPVVLLLFGIRDFSKVLIVALVLFFQLLVVIRDSVRHLEPQYLLSIRSLGARRLQVFRWVIWPYLLPRLISALRVGSGTALAVLFFAETFSTRYGLGFMIVDSWMRIDYPQMFAGIVGIGLVGLLIFAALDWLEARACRWQRQV
jgi:NitT/TauT family transport system permease protein